MFDIEKARARGMTESQIKIMQHINENNYKCDMCPGHDFNMPTSGSVPLVWVCTKCGYDASNAYVKGYHDAELKAAKHHLEERR